MIGVIGSAGVVGSAVANAFSKFGVLGIDKKSQKAHWDKVKECEVVFVCVPTPQAKDGHVDLSILDEVMGKLGKNQLIVIKSTIPPGTTEKYIKKYGKNVVHCPEFLTEANAKDDFLNPDRVVIGATDLEIGLKVESYYQKILPYPCVLHVTPTEAELIKYLSNSFLAMKVLFANEGKFIADKFGAKWDNVAMGMGMDKRIGQTHLKVTQEGGYGGMCFPKDTIGLAMLLHEHQIHTDIIGKLAEINAKWRKYE